MAVPAPAVVIVVLNYRGRDFTVNCVTSLRLLTYPNYTTVIVDNASGDDSVETFRRELPDAALLEVTENRGYTGGNNVGIRHAMASGAAYVHILNQDTLVADPAYLDRLVEYMEAHPRVGAAGPKVFWHERGVIQDTVLHFPGVVRSLRAHVREFLGRDRSHSGLEPLEVEAINGVCVLLRRELLEAIGLFDERLFLYADEIEFGWRAKQAGWTVAYVPTDGVIHLGTDRHDPLGDTSFLMKRNTIYVRARMGNVADAWLCAGASLLSLALTSVLASIRFDRPRAHWQHWWRLCRAYWDVLTRNRMEWAGPRQGRASDEELSSERQS